MIRSRYRYRGGLVSAAPPPFVPTDIAGLQLWLDASDTATITQAANLVSQWNDKSGNANHATQGTGAAQPTTNTRTINSLNVLDFDGSNDWLNLTTGLNSSSGQTFFFVVNFDVLTGSHPCIGTNDVVQGPQLGGNSAPAWRLVRTGVAVLLTGSPAIAATTNYIAGGNYSTSGRDLFVNGASYGTDPTSTTFTNGSTLIGGAGGVSSTPALYLNGVLGEVIVYSGNLSTTDKNRVGNYLAAKWGITWTGL